MGQLGSRRYESFGESHQFDAGSPLRIFLPDGPPEHRSRRLVRERDIAGVTPPARVHRQAPQAMREALERC